MSIHRSTAVRVRGVVKQHTDKFWAAPRRARTDKMTSGPELVQSARVWHLWVTCYTFSQEQRHWGGTDRKQHIDWVHKRSEYFNEMQIHEDFAVMAALRWDNL